MEVSATFIWMGFVLAAIAAFSTFLGAMTSLYFRTVDPKTLSGILGFAAGIMLYTAFMKFMPESVAILSSEFSYREVKLVSVLCFFFGVVLLYPLGYILSWWNRRKRRKGSESGQDYRQVAVLVLMAISAHSFVEGLAAFLSNLTAPLVAIPLVLSLIVHNFPEGMTIGVLFNKIGDTLGRKRVVFYSLVASLFEPIGAVTAYIFVLRYSTPVLTGMLKSFLSGLLVATALNELIPHSQLKGMRSVSVQSIIFGMMVMGMVLVVGAYL